MQNLPSGKATWLWKLPFLVDLPVKKKKLSWFTKRVRTYTVHEHYICIYIYVLSFQLDTIHHHPRLKPHFLLVIPMENYDNYDRLFRPHESKSLLTYINPMNSAAKSPLFHLHPS